MFSTQHTAPLFSLRPGLRDHMPGALYFPSETDFCGMCASVGFRAAVSLDMSIWPFFAFQTTEQTGPPLALASQEESSR